MPRSQNKRIGDVPDVEQMIDLILAYKVVDVHNQRVPREYLNLKVGADMLVIPKQSTNI